MYRIQTDARVITGNTTEIKNRGRTHKDNISDLDWQQLRSYFSDVLTTLDIKKLAYYVWFNTTLHFCLRGNEAQSKLKKTDLLFTTIEGERAIFLGERAIVLGERAIVLKKKIQDADKPDSEHVS